MKIELTRRKIHLDDIPDRELARRCAKVPGYNKRDAAWPLSLATCYALREMFGSALAVGPALNKWAAAEIERQARLGEIAGASDVELIHLGLLAPSLATAMGSRTYQRAAAAFIADGGNVLVADQQGLGKTLEVLAGITERGTAGGWHLVLAPLVAVTAVWPGEIAHRMDPDRTLAVPITGPGVERHAELAKLLSGPPDVRDRYVIGNIEMVRWHPKTGPTYPELFSIEWDTVVVDESHLALIKADTGPSRTASGLKLPKNQSQTRTGATKLRAKHKVATSGTPMRGKPTQFWGTLNWLRPDVYTNYWDWVAMYWALKSNGYTDYIVDKPLPDGMARLAADMRSIMIRRTKQEVLTELPPIQYAGTYLIPHDEASPHGVWLPVTERQERQLAQLDKDGILKFRSRPDLICNGALAKRTRALQIASAPIDAHANPTLPCPKFDWLVEKLDEIDGKVVVGAHSTRLIELFAHELEDSYDTPAFVLTGRTPAGRRAGMIETFQSDDDEIRLFMLNIKAGGVSVTLDAADDLILLDESTIPDEREQVEARLHRASRMHQVTVHQLRTLGTLEEEVAWVSAAREDVQKYLLDGSRGVTFARQVYVDRKSAGALDSERADSSSFDRSQA